MILVAGRDAGDFFLACTIRLRLLVDLLNKALQNLTWSALGEMHCAVSHHRLHALRPPNGTG